jgi:hypothetical protein
LTSAGNAFRSLLDDPIQIMLLTFEGSSTA